MTSNSKIPVAITTSEWFDYFQDLLNTDVHIDEEYKFNIEQDMLFHDDHCENCQNDEPYDLNREFTIEEITQYIKKLPNGKASGEDGICNELLKHSVHIISPILREIFNKILITGNFPDSWCNAIITPLHKKGDKNNLNNYRGISLLSAISKVFTGLLNQRLSNWVENNDLLYEEQAGFRSKKSTIDHLFTLYAVVKKYLSKPGGRLYCLFIDFSKAFDRVPHLLLFHRLLLSGTHGSFIAVIRSMYTKLSACVNTPEGLTEYFKCLIGTRQGCMLSPLIFVLFLNSYIELVAQEGCKGIYLDEFFHNLQMLCYADDIAEVSDMVGHLQKRLLVLEQFCKITGMEVSLAKTKIMVFRNGGPLRRNEKWYYKNELLETTTYYKYLGVFLSSRLNWSFGIKTLCVQSQKAINMIKRLIGTCRGLPHSIIFNIFDTTVVPVLTYSSEVWGYEPRDEIETVHLKFCKYILGVGTTTPNVAVLGELGRFPIFVQTYIKCVKYWLKLIHLQDGALPKSAYLMLYKLDENGKTNWVTYIKHLLSRYGFGYAFFNQGVGDIDVFLRIFKQRVKDNYLQEWHSNVDISSKLSNYKCFKSVFEYEDYLNVVNIRKYCVALSRFRCGNHKLPIETGRHHGIPVEDRICVFCFEKTEMYIHDEYHFLCKCSKFEDLRVHYFETSYMNFYEFNELLASKCPERIVKLAGYIYHGMKNL